MGRATVREVPRHKIVKVPTGRNRRTAIRRASKRVRLDVAAHRRKTGRSLEDGSGEVQRTNRTIRKMEIRVNRLPRKILRRARMGKAPIPEILRRKMEMALIKDSRHRAGKTAEA